MKRIVLGTWMLGLLWASTGCATNAVVGNSSVRAAQFYGDLGITGRGNNVTIQRGSRIWKLSIIGDNNTATVEEGVTLNRIEFWGNGNVVSVPENLLFRATEVGGNQIIRRPLTHVVAEEPMPLEPLPQLPERRQPMPPPAPVPVETVPPPKAYVPPPAAEPPLK